MAQGGLLPAQVVGLNSKLQRLCKDWHNELCAEHDGTIASFARLDAKILDLHKYGELFKRDQVNLNRVVKYVGHGLFWTAVALALASTMGTAGAVAASLGKLGLLGAASTGTAIVTLSGAALTSASLAYIGGSVAVGTFFVISAVGLGLGGIYGGVIANRYHADDPDFAVLLIADAASPRRTVFVNGFLTEDEKTFAEWAIPQLNIESDQRLYGVTWSSKSLRALGSTITSAIHRKILARVVEKLARGKKGGILGLIDLAADAVGNPWHVSMVRAGQTGVLLAEILAREEGPQVTLVGHSLGCRVIYYALEALATKTTLRVANVILLGGAVGRGDIEGWRNAAKAVSGTIFNCHSSRDDVLRVMYRTANLKLSEPIGLGPIDLSIPQIQNVDCSDLVDSHFTWKANYAAIIGRIQNKT